MSRTPPRIRAVVFDWAGTTVDHGSLAPVEVFLEVFRRAEVEVSAAEVRGPMGRAKRNHIEALLALPRVAEAWYTRHGQPPVRQTSIGSTPTSCPCSGSSSSDTAR